MPRILVEIEGEEAADLLEQLAEIQENLNECTAFIQKLKEHQVFEKLKEANP